MKKWIIIALSTTAIVVWIAFFFVLIGKAAPSLIAKPHTESMQEEVALSKDMKRFELTDTTNEKKDNVIQSDKRIAHSDDILYQFEQDSAVSIDELLAALKLEIE